MSLTIYRNGTALSNGAVLRNVEMTFGAPLGLGTPVGEASRCAFQIYNLPAEDQIQPGDLIAITYDPGTGDIPRFTGNAYSVEISWSTVERSVTTVAASGTLAAIGRSIDGMAYPPTIDQMSDGERITYYLDRAFTPSGTPVVYSVDPGTVQIAERDNVSEGVASTLDLLEQTANAGMGIVVDQPDGSVTYFDRFHARNTSPAYTLDASQILAEISTTITTETLINSAAVTFAVPGMTGSAYNDASVAVFGEYPGGGDLPLADYDSAQDIADEYVFRYSFPRYSIPELTIDERVSPELLPEVELGQVIAIQGLPQPTRSSMYAVVQNYRETWRDEDSWQIELGLVDARWWGRALTWGGVDVAETWDTWDPDMTWAEVFDAYDYPALMGTWSAIPANLTFANCDAQTGSATWDTWSM